MPFRPTLRFSDVKRILDVLPQPMPGDPDANLKISPTPRESHNLATSESGAVRIDEGSLPITYKSPYLYVVRRDASDRLGSNITNSGSIFATPYWVAALMYRCLNNSRPPRWRDPELPNSDWPSRFQLALWLLAARPNINQQAAHACIKKYRPYAHI